MRLRHFILSVPLQYPFRGVFCVLSFFAALLTRLRRNSPRSDKPRIVWGRTPIGGTQYYSRACHAYGYDSHTLMYGRYFINASEDFDYYPEKLSRAIQDPSRNEGTGSNPAFGIKI